MPSKDSMNVHCRNKQLQRKVHLVRRTGAIQHWGNSCETILDSVSSVCHTKGIILTEERKRKMIPACPSFKGRSLSTAISKSVMRLVRHHDQEERETNGAVHWDTINPKLLRACGYQGARHFSEKGLASVHL